MIEKKRTSRKCSECGHISKDNRKNQATFVCQKCSNEDNEDHNAAKNILEPGRALLACGDIKPVEA